MKSLNILVLSTTDDGGAGIAAHKISRLFLRMGHNPKLVVLRSKKKDQFIQVISAPASFLSKLINKCWHFYFRYLGDAPDYYFFGKDERFSPITSTVLSKNLAGFKPDLIIVGWTSGFLNFKAIADLSIKYEAPAYFWLADMGPITGGCHYSWDCIEYTKSCSKCPALKNKFFNVAANNLLIRKNDVQRASLKVIGGSPWVAHQAKASTLFGNQENIISTNCMVDGNIYRPVFSTNYSKPCLNIDSGCKVIFFAANSLEEKRKGVMYFKQSLKYLVEILTASELSQVYILLAGKYDIELTQFLETLGMSYQSLGFLADEHELARAYQASDAYISSSIQDSGPMMIGDALACGTPVISFNVGLARDIIVNDYNGQIVMTQDSFSLAQAIQKILFLMPHELRSSLRLNSFTTAQKYCSESFAADNLRSILP